MKKQLYRFFIIIILAFLFILPFSFVIFKKITFGWFFLFSLLVLFIFFIFSKLRSNILRKFRSSSEKLEETKNLLVKNIEEKKKILDILPLQLDRVFSLFKLSKQLIGLIDVDEIIDFIITNVQNLFSEAENILLFLSSESADSLKLVRSVKKEKVAIKEKHADIIDRWVLKNNYSLLIDDITKDFRFNYNDVLAFKERSVFSILSSPISVGHRVFGVLRLENKKPFSFSFDDSRLLRSICDLGAVVLEKAIFFKKIEELAIKDPLTSLFLKSYFLDRLSKEIKRAEMKNSNIGVLMLDIDNFKKINDTYGHIVGDIVLKKLASVLIEIVGDAGNVISRFGGEEFIIFIVECNKEKLLNIGEEIRKTQEKLEVNFRKKTIHFTVSIGAVLYPQEAKDINSILDTVDKLLYKAKKEGKNRLCYI